MSDDRGSAQQLGQLERLNAFSESILSPIVRVHVGAEMLF